jgi:hypothetical protein
MDLRTGKTYASVVVLLALLGGVVDAAAQPKPVIPVLGVGELVLVVDAPLARAQAQTYRAYIDARPALALTVTCVAVGSGSECAAPLSALKLTGQHAIEVTAVVVAADGERESPRVALPFDLSLAAPPVAPSASGKVRPQP